MSSADSQSGAPAADGRLASHLLQSRLYFSPLELQDLLHAHLRGLGDLVCLFIRSGAADARDRGINPRQSFVWRDASETVEPFNKVVDVYRALGLEPPQTGNARDIRLIRTLVARAGGAFRSLSMAGMPETIALFSRHATASAAALRASSSPLLAYLEQYRAQSLHSLNDTYMTRHAELLRFVPQMSASTAVTAQRMLAHFASHRRFGGHAYALLERTASDSSAHEAGWHVVKSTDEQAGVTAERLLAQADVEFIASRKVLGVLRDGEHTLFIPFTRVDRSFSFRLVDEREYEAVTTQHVPSAVHVGDLVLCLLHRGVPRHGVVHSILYFRQYYFETYKPALLEHLRDVLNKRTASIQDELHNTPREDRPSDPWAALKATCGEVFPTLGTLLGVSLTIRIYDVGREALKRVHTWDLPQDKRLASLEETEYLSVRKGERGINAATYLDKEPSIYVEDISRIATPKHGRLHAPYCRHRAATQSEYCHKLMFRNVPVGTINFESPRINGIPRRIQTFLAPFIKGFENYVREFINVQDAAWLALTAATYDNLHELRQSAETKDFVPSPEVLAAISAFDKAGESAPGQLTELQAFFTRQLENNILAVPVFARASFAEAAAHRCKFSVLGFEELNHRAISRMRIELIKVIFRNMLGDFNIYSEDDDKEIFTIHTVEKPVRAVQFRQVRVMPFDETWEGALGFRPITTSRPNDRLHHGIFLCSAIARYLGGYAWLGNETVEELGTRSVMRILVPLFEGAE